MTSLSRFFRSTPAASLMAYFEKANIDLPKELDLKESHGDVTDAFLKVVNDLPDGDRRRMLADIDHVQEMTDDAGQVALYSVVSDRSELDDLRSGHDRALWLFLNERGLFDKAADVRFTEDKRRGRMWTGFTGLPELPVRRDLASMEAFKQALRQHFDSPNVEVDVFERTRPSVDGPDYKLLQLTIYTEEPPESFREFRESRLDWNSRKPVREAAVTYEPLTGVTEVVAKGDQHSRGEIARLFVSTLLESQFADQRLPLRRFDLETLQQRHAFPTDPEDGIESVRLTSLRLMPMDSQGERVTLECMSGAGTTIWDLAQDRFADANPLDGGWVVTQARLTVKFRPAASGRRSRTLSVSISMPHGCDLKERTEHERLIGDKYLSRWGLLENV